MVKKILIRFMLILSAFQFLPGPLRAAEAPHPGPVIQLAVEGIIDPITARYIERGIRAAEKQGAQLVVITLDTPGGLDQAMRQITQQLLNAPLPVAVYVFPSGARAASAGAFMGMAAHYLFMAPGTTIGAAHPVDLQGKQASEKITRDAEAYLASLANLRGRNQLWAERMVSQSAALTDRQAIEKRVADFSADSVADLLAQLEGKTGTWEGKPGSLSLQQARIITRPMQGTEKFLHLLTNPNLAYVLFLIGIYGMIYELASPGAILPGVAGGISLLLALVGFEGLPLSWTGIFLLILGAVFFILEIFIVSHGVLALGGGVALVLGTMMLYPSANPDFRITTTLTWLSGAGSLMFAGLVAGVAWHTRKHRQKYSGMESLIGAQGIIRSISPEGTQVQVQGEVWLVFDPEPTFQVGQKVEIVGLQGLKLKIRILSEGN